MPAQEAVSDAENYARLMDAFDDLQDASPSDRASKLEAYRTSDPALAESLEALLAADDSDHTPLEQVVDISSLFRSATFDRRLAAHAEQGRGREDAPLPAALGETVGMYRLIEVLGRGGMGCVYRGVHEALGRDAAIKILEPRLAEDTAYVSRFLHEAKIVNAVRHPNIVDVYDFVETDEPRRVAFVMELLRGPSLGGLLASRALDLDEALSATVALCDALAAVHARGVVHRDLKPDNVMVVGPLATADIEVPLKLLDFGIAKVPDPSAMHQTATGVMMGTPTYMAPEQFAAEPATPATDVYAVAELLYEMLTQRSVFSGTGLGLMRQKISGKPPDLELPGGLRGSKVLGKLLQACLRSDPKARPPIAEVQKVLTALRSPGEAPLLPRWTAPPEPDPPLGPPESPDTLRRPRWATGVLAALVLGVLLWAVWAQQTSPDLSDGSDVIFVTPPKAALAGAGSLASVTPAPTATVAFVAPTAELPAIIYGDPPHNTPYAPDGYMGDFAAMTLEPESTDNPRSAPTCLKVTYTGSEWSGVAWLDPPGDWGNLPGGLNLQNATKLSIWARSPDRADSNIGFGLILRDRVYFDTARAESAVTLTPEWKRYVFDLRGKNLSRVKIPFFFTLIGQGKPITIYFDDVRFE